MTPPSRRLRPPNQTNQTTNPASLDDEGRIDLCDRLPDEVASYAADHPPSEVTMAPLTLEASSEASQDTTVAI